MCVCVLVYYMDWYNISNVYMFINNGIYTHTYTQINTFHIKVYKHCLHVYRQCVCVFHVYRIPQVCYYISLI